MSPRVTKLDKKQKNIDRDEFLKPKTNTDKKQYTCLIEQMCDWIRDSVKRGKIDLKTGIRIWTPFTKDQGVLLQEGDGYIIKPPENDAGVEHDIYVQGGALKTYDAIAKCMSGHYDKTHLEKIKGYLMLQPKPGRLTLAKFNTTIKTTWTNPTENLIGDNKKIESVRKALNYFSAILFAETYRYNSVITKPKNLIDKLIRKWKPGNTPIKRVLCRDGDAQDPLTMPNASDIAREEFGISKPLLKKPKNTKKKKKISVSTLAKKKLQEGRIKRGRKSGSTRTYSLKPRTTTLHIDNDEEDSE